MTSKSLSFLRSKMLWRYILSISIATIFVFAGIMKLLDPTAFMQDIRNYRILSEPLSAFLAASLPWLEIVSGVSLLLPPLRLTASFIITGLMTVFTIAVTTALMRGLDVSCGCFGKAFSEYAGAGIGFLFRDIVFLILSTILLILNLRDSHIGVVYLGDTDSNTAKDIL